MEYSEGFWNFKLPLLCECHFPVIDNVQERSGYMYISFKDCTIRTKMYRMKPRNFNIL